MSADSPQPLQRLADLLPKTALRGRITRIEPYGAFADVGVEREGLLHISRLSAEKVNRIEDLLQVGQEVEVWVHLVEPSTGRLELTMIRPLGVEWRDLKPGVRLKGKVIRLERFGAFVEIGAERAGLVHISEMAPGGVTDPAEAVSVGEEVEVTVLESDRRKKQIRLSMKQNYQVEESEAPPIPTAMELALRKAMEAGGTDRSGPGSARRKEAAQRTEQEEILARTLRDKVRTQASGE